MPAKKLSAYGPLIEEGRELVREHFNSEIRVQTVGVRLLSHYLDLLEKTAEVKAKLDAAGISVSAGPSRRPRSVCRSV